MKNVLDSFNGRQNYIARFALVRGNEYVGNMNKKVQTIHIYDMPLVIRINRTTVNKMQGNPYPKQEINDSHMSFHSLICC